MNKYTREFIVEDFLCKDGELTLNNIINYLIETSNYHSNSYGLTNERLMKSGYTWMIYKWRIKILKYPRTFEKIKVKTWASGFEGLNAFREFEIFIDEERLVYASSIFLLIDLKNRKPVKIPKEIADIYKINEKRFFEKIKRINEPRDTETINNFDYTILKRDIDLNEHVNNSVYAELLYEALPEKFSKTKFTDISINYSKELKLKDNVFIDVYKEDKRLLFFFKNRERREIYARASLAYIS